MRQYLCEKGYYHLAYSVLVVTQQTFTCSKLTKEILEQGVKHVQSQRLRHQNDVNLVSLLLTLNMFNTLH